jgi:hypothetical protein
LVPAGTDHLERVLRPPIGGGIHVPSPTFAVFLVVGDDPMLCTFCSQRRKSLCWSIVTPQFFLTVAQESSRLVSYTSWLGCTVEILVVDFDVDLPDVVSPPDCFDADGSSGSEKTLDSLREFVDSGSGSGMAHVSRARARACSMAEMPPSGSKTPNSLQLYESRTESCQIYRNPLLLRQPHSEFARGCCRSGLCRCQRLDHMHIYCSIL